MDFFMLCEQAAEYCIGDESKREKIKKANYESILEIFNEIMDSKNINLELKEKIFSLHEITNNMYCTMIDSYLPGENFPDRGTLFFCRKSKRCEDCIKCRDISK